MLRISRENVPDGDQTSIGFGLRERGGWWWRGGEGGGGVVVWSYRQWIDGLIREAVEISLENIGWHRERLGPQHEQTTLQRHAGSCRWGLLMRRMEAGRSTTACRQRHGKVRYGEAR